jgi:hypothetical protein
VLVLSGAQVEALLDLRTLIDALGPAMTELSAGRAQAPELVGCEWPAAVSHPAVFEPLNRGKPGLLGARARLFS